MTEKQKDGGPAFPARPTERFVGGAEITAHHGMSLRDWFAGNAMASLLSNNATIAGIAKLASDRGSDSTSVLADASYEYADAMIAAREASK